uniref:KAT8 regulatory NSL complex subunit 3 n=1 Tax=Lygus hesperus TaxID=30085 RepID=A0A146KX35_LYGHE
METPPPRSDADSIAPANKLSVYLQQLSGQVDMVHSIDLDHSYSLPNNWKPDNAYAKPVKTLFVTKKNAVLSSSSIDVVECDDERRRPRPAYDEGQAKQNMGETEKTLYSLLSTESNDPDWEYKLNRTQWTTSQAKLFDRALRILSHDRLARLTQQSSWNEPVLRRVSIDKSARRFRTLLSTYSWKAPLLHWLHNTFVDFLDIPYLASYIDVLQTLKKKVPALVERMISSVNYNSRIPPEAMTRMLKKPVDPASYGLSCYNPKRLPGNPLIVVVPSAPGTNTLQNARVQRWFHCLSMIGHVTLVSTNNLLATKATMTTSLDHMLAATRAKLSELRSDYAGRTIILVGFNTGAALACQVALMEQVTAVVCLGFPLNTVEDRRGQPDDSILNLTTPVLFIAGQHGPSASIDDLEDLRERLRVESGLIVVGSADDQLRVHKSKLSQEGITQCMVDRCIVDEIADFVGTILTAPPPQIHGSSTGTSTPVKTEGRAKMKFVEKKRKLSGSEESMPTVQPKKTQIVLNPFKRSVGRPSTRGVGRPKATFQGSDFQPRRSGLTKEALMAATARQSIEPLNMSDFDLLGSDDGTGLTSEDNLMEQLTPDRLLEMPVIIAQEDTPEPSQMKMVMSRGRVGRPPGPKNRNPKNHGPVKIIVSKDGITHVPKTVRTLGIHTNKDGVHRIKDGRPRIKHFPATKHILSSNVMDMS